jgi:D-sedoheptulose 7-phosphate isomerase
MVIEFTNNYLADMKRIFESIELANLERVVGVLHHAYEMERQIFVMGNGGSGSTASHFASDMNKSASSGLEKKFKVICLSDNIPIMLAYANDLSYEDIFREQLKNFLKSEDVVIGISGSGNSKNVVKAIQYANEKGAISIGLTGFDGGEVARLADVSIIVPVNDMQRTEDTHLILCHIITQISYRMVNHTDVL